MNNKMSETIPDTEKQIATSSLTSEIDAIFNFICFCEVQTMTILDFSESHTPSLTGFNSIVTRKKVYTGHMQRDESDQFGLCFRTY